MSVHGAIALFLPILMIGIIRANLFIPGNNDAYSSILLQDSLDKRSVAIGRGGFRPAKRAASPNSEFQTDFKDIEDLIEVRQPRSSALGRLNFRPAKRSQALGRLGFRPAKRSPAYICASLADIEEQLLTLVKKYQEVSAQC